MKRTGQGRIITRFADRIRRTLGPADPGSLQQAGYPVVNGPRYEPYLRYIHAHENIDWYLEVGTESGKSLVGIRANTISIDPAFNLKYEVTGDKPRLFLFQTTSDDFFQSRFLEQNEIKIDMAFLDGMHQFEFLLRDFINTESYASPEGRIFMHDCIPINAIMARREWESYDSRYWAGDVWKILPILAQFRPELRISVLNLKPTGLVVVEGLQPDNRILQDHYDDIVRQFETMTIEEFGLERFQTEFQLCDVDVDAVA